MSMTTPNAATLGADEEAVRKAISSTARPPKASPLSAALSFGWRGMLKVKHVPEQLLDVTITPVMFVLMFTYLFGGAIAGAGRHQAPSDSVTLPAQVRRSRANPGRVDSFHRRAESATRSRVRHPVSHRAQLVMAVTERPWLPLPGISASHVPRSIAEKALDNIARPPLWNSIFHLPANVLPATVYLHVLASRRTKRRQFY